VKSIRMSDVTRNPDVHHVEIQTNKQWKAFMKTLNEGLHVITHDSYFWHGYKGIKNPVKHCVISDRIRFKFETWEGARFYTFHHKSGDLWFTLRLPDHYCLDCNKKIRLHRTLCRGCVNRNIHKNRPFYERYDDISYSVADPSSELTYGLLANLDQNQRLVVEHIDCSTPIRCLHIRNLAYKLYGRLLPYWTKVVGSTSYFVRRSRHGRNS
jgi:hypothetical protein